MPTPDLMAGQAAKALGMSRKTVARWCAAGRVPGAYQAGAGRYWKIPAATVEKIRKGEVNVRVRR